jgi:hypothetical protein
MTHAYWAALEKLRLEREQLAAERAAVEKQRAEVEAAKQERLQQERKIRDEEEARKAKKEEERLDQERRPASEKLEAFGDYLNNIQRPDLKTDWGHAILEEVFALILEAATIASEHDHAN